MITLYKHNEEGYKNLEEMLGKTRFATINHATGTGKSFIAIKYLYNHKDKKFLYIAPTYEILNQFISRDIKSAGIDPNELSVDTMIYRNLLSTNIKELYDKYDGFILDEYHRAGARETNKKILELKELIKNGKDEKKLIGLTATPVRYLDQQRNMTEEIFEGNTASDISLAEAIVEGILPVPQYFIRYSFIKDELEKTIKKVNRLYPSVKKTKLLKEINEIEKDIEKDNDLTNLFSQNIKENGKYILFSSTISEMKKSMNHSYTWFKDYKTLNIYEVYSLMKKEEIKEQIRAFDDAQSGLNIMFAVDLFSEGVHPKRVDGVILNRSTSSPIIYLQQLGRTLTSSNVNTTVQVFDLKSNYISHEAITNLYSEIIKLANQKIEEFPDEREKYEKIINSFIIVDNSSRHIDRLKKIRKEITYETVINSKVEYIINSLEKYIIDNNLEGKVITGLDIEDINLKKLYYELYKYKEFVTQELKEQLEKLNIVFPNNPNITKEDKAKTKIDFFINSLEAYLKENNLFGEVISEFNLEDEMLQKLYIEVLKLTKYITIPQMVKLQDLNVLLPKELMKSPYERKEELKGYESESELEKAKHSLKMERIIEFLKNNNLEDNNEMYEDFIYLMNNASKEEKEKIRSIVKQDNLKTLDKVLLDIPITNEEIIQFFNTCQIIFETNKSIESFYEEALKIILSKYDTPIKNRINILLEKINEEKVKQQRIELEEENKRLFEIIKYIESFEFKDDIEKDKTFQKMYMELSDKDKQKTRKHIETLFQNKNTDLINLQAQNLKMTEYVKLLKSCDIDNLNLLKRKLDDYHEKIKYLNEYVDSQIRNKNINCDEIITEFNDIITEEDIKTLIKGNIRKFKIKILKILKELEIKVGLCNYVIFCLTNKRRPISKIDESEIELNKTFVFIRDTIPTKTFNIINDYLNTEEIRKGTERQIVINAENSRTKTKI